MRGQRELDWERDPWVEQPEPRRRPWYEVISTPPGIAFNAVVAAAVGVLLLMAVPPAMPFLGLLFIVPLLGLLGVTWFTRLCLYIGPRIRRLQPRGPRGFLVAPALVLGAGAMIMLDVPLRVGFVLSRPQLERVAEQVRRGDAERIRPERRVGVFLIDSVARSGGGVHFDYLGGFGSAGFVHRPGGPPGWLGNLGYSIVDLGGDWYAYSAEFD